MAKHYLTYEGLTSCTVNGQAVESGYELKDGDVIVATYSASWSLSGTFFQVNGHMYKNESLDVTNSDISIGIFSSGTGGGD